MKPAPQATVDKKSPTTHSQPQSQFATSNWSSFSVPLVFRLESSTPNVPPCSIVGWDRKNSFSAFLGPKVSRLLEDNGIIRALDQQGGSDLCAFPRFSSALRLNQANPMGEDIRRVQPGCSCPGVLACLAADQRPKSDLPGLLKFGTTLMCANCANCGKEGQSKQSSQQDGENPPLEGNHERTLWQPPLWRPS
jgi:hypothetical protein